MIGKEQLRNDRKYSNSASLVCRKWCCRIFHGDVSKKSPEIPCNNYRLISWGCLSCNPMDAGKEPIPELFQGLAGLTGCGGIEDMDQILNSTELTLCCIALIKAVVSFEINTHVTSALVGC